jgi:hypothetical protein
MTIPEIDQCSRLQAAANEARARLRDFRPSAAAIREEIAAVETTPDAATRERLQSALPGLVKELARLEARDGKELARLEAEEREASAAAELARLAALEVEVERASSALRGFSLPVSERLARLDGELAALEREIAAATAAGDVDRLSTLQQRRPALAAVVEHERERENAAGVAERARLASMLERAKVQLQQARDAHAQRLYLLHRAAETMRRQISVQEQTEARSSDSPASRAALQRSRGELVRLQDEIARLTVRD